MSKGRTLLIASAVAGAMVFVGVVAASAAGRGGATNFLAAASPSPSPGFKSNETSSHEAGESAARENAENSGTFHPGGPGGGPGGSNETSAHETGETAAQEASENARATATPTP